MNNQAQTTILIVEDDERIAKLLKQFLASEGFNAMVQHSAEDALEALPESDARSYCFGSDVAGYGWRRVLSENSS